MGPSASGSTVYAGGDFTVVGGQPRNRIAAFDATTGALMPWNPDADDGVEELVVSGATVYAGGRFTSVGGEARIGIAAIDENSGLATAWNLRNAVGADTLIGIYALAVGNSTVYAGGVFTTVGGRNPKYLAGFTDDALPVELTRFDAVADGPAAVLRWTTASETNNAGFEVEEKTNDGYRQVGFVAGRGTTTVEQQYEHRLEDLPPGRHTFRLRQIDFDGTFAYSPEVELTVALGDAFVLSPAFPNPFHSRTTVRFAVRKPGDVEVGLYNVLGQRVRVLYRGTVPAGDVQVLDIDAGGLPSGTYFVRLEGEGVRAVERLLLVR